MSKKKKRSRKRRESDPYEAAGNRLIRDRERVANKIAKEVDRRTFG